MNILSLENISKSFNNTELLNETSFYLNEGDKVGIIGINGTGKSTLLKIIAGIEEPDEGKVTIANNIVIRYLPQTPEFEENEKILEYIVRQNESKVNPRWEIESEAKKILMNFQISDFNKNVEELSGGQKKKVALASVLVSKADILILDEPTNHLDSEMSSWLEDYLKNFKGCLIMVTHDRYFLDMVTGRIVEIDRGKLYNYDADYLGYLELKAEREDMMLASERKRKSILRNEIEWMKRGARARSTKQKARIERYEELKNSKYVAESGDVSMSSVYSRLGKTTVELNGITKIYNEKKLFDNFEYIFLKNDRVGFIGKNGCGKTTLMKMIAGKLNPDQGEIVRGQTVKIGYYTQEISADKADGIAYMDPKIRVIDYIRNTAEFVQTTEGSVSASVMLDRFLFPPEKQYTYIEKLSGGEKRRLNLLRVLMEAPNVLILDEPTNDLDIRTLTILEDYLDSFNGIVITVSHDRYFLDRVVKRIFAFENNHINQYEGNYTDYEIRRSFENPENSGVYGNNGNSGNGKGDNRQISGKNKSDNDISGLVDKAMEYRNQKKQNKKLKLTYAEQKDYDNIEKEISELEEKIEKLEKEMEVYASDFGKLNDITKEISELKEKLDERMERWMYLEDLVEQINNQ